MKSDFETNSITYNVTTVPAPADSKVTIGPYQPTPTPCPTCGHCPTCGRGGYHVAPYNPPTITWYGIGSQAGTTGTYLRNVTYTNN